MSATILDIVDDFTDHGRLDVRTAPGTALHELAHTVQSATLVSPEPTSGGTPVWLGGWPSANFWAVGGDMLLSSLLYSPRVVVRDPISDWFSKDQYAVEHLTPARPGHFSDVDRGIPNIMATRSFLSTVLPELEAWRPLIDAGIVTLVHSAEHHLANRQQINDLHRYLEKALLDDPVGYAAQFSPMEMATEDNVRGMFVFAGGDRETQLRRAQSHALRYLAREYLLATSCGADYTAPFRHEQHVCRHGVATALGPSERVVHALVSSQMPIFSGLDPSVVAKVHDDPNIAEFRRDLHLAYKDMPIDSDDRERARYLHDQELHQLGPAIARAERRAHQQRLRARSRRRRRCWRRNRRRRPRTGHRSWRDRWGDTGSVGRATQTQRDLRDGVARADQPPPVSFARDAARAGRCGGQP